MRSYRKKQILILILLLVAVFSISIGFAAFSSTLNITPEVGITPDAADFSVKFSTTQDSLTVGEVEPYSMTDGVTATNAMIDNSGIPTISNMSAVYTGPGDYVTYRFYVRNDGEYLAYLNSITFNGGNVCSEKIGTTASQATDACNDIIMTVKVGDVSVTETTLNILDETLNPGESKIVEVTVQYSENGYIPDGDFSLEFGTVSLYYASTGGINEPKACNIERQVAGTYTIGDLVTCGQEQFYVIENEDTDITAGVDMLAVKNINATGTGDIIQINNAGSSTFSTINYWSMTTSSYPAYVYNNNSTMYQYIDAYVVVLSTLGVDVLKAKPMSYEQAITLGCSIADKNCSSAPSWVYSSAYWLGSVFNANQVYFIGSGGSFRNDGSYGSYIGIRPVITIYTSEIES